MKNLLIVAFLLPQTIYAQTLFNISSGRTTDDYIDYATFSQEVGGGYIFQGATAPASNPLNGNIAIVKTDATGSILWQKNYEIGTESQYSYLGSMSVRSDNTSCVVGGTTSNGGFIFRLDALGNVQWLQKFTDNYSAYLKCVIKTSDGNFIACGRHDQQGLVVKFTPTGTILFKKKLTYPPGTASTTEYICQTTDGNYVVASEGHGTIAGDVRSCITKLDGSGNLLWTKNFDLSLEFDHVTCVNATSSGGVILCLTSNMPNQSTTNYCSVVKIDGSGNIIWSKTITGLLSNYVAELPSGDICLTATIPGSGNYSTGCLIKINSGGTLVWSKTLPCKTLNCINQSGDGNYLLSGETPWGIDHWGPGAFPNFYMAKVNSSGINCASLTYTIVLGSGPISSSQSCTISNSTVSFNIINSSGYTVTTLPFTNVGQCLCAPDAGLDQTNGKYPCCNPVCSSVTIGTAAVPGYNYLWAPTSTLSCTTCAQPVATPCATTEYTMTVTSGTCIKNSDKVVVTTLTYTGCQCGGGGDSPGGEGSRFLSNELFEVYPVPTTESVQIKVPFDTNNVELAVFDMHGKLIFNQLLGISESSEQIILNTENWSEGLYIVRLYCADGSNKSKKIIVDH